MMTSMSQQLVGLLRGINVGRAKRVAMADLRALVEELGYGEVRTLLNSGNVLFSGADGAARAGARIEAALLERTGISSRVTVLTGAEVSAIVADNPLRERVDEPSRMLVSVLADRADLRRVEPLLAQEWGSEAIAVGERAVYVWCPDGVLQSRLPEAVGRLLGDAVTTRNWATMTKLDALVRG